MRGFSFSLYSALSLLSLWTCLANPISKRDFGPVNIFTPPSSYVAPKTMYGRHVMLPDSAGTLLATWENYSAYSGATFPIFRSTDHGFTWTKISEVKDTQNGVGLPYQPMLYVLPQAIGNYPKGTVLIAGNSAVTPTGTSCTSTQLELYASRDNGLTWTFVSHITPRAGGTNDGTPVWEPFLMVYNNQLICYYSDERDNAYNQKLVYQATSDLVNWGNVVNVVAETTNSNGRPGMAVVSKIPNNQYFLTYEYCNPPSGVPGCAVYYRISPNPLNFQAAPEARLIATDGTSPTSSPYNIWTPIGASSGTTTNGAIVVNAYSDSSLYVNRQLGASNAWTRLSTSSPGQYSRSLSVGFNPKDIVIVGGGPFQGHGESE